jgi:hypothetical protein
MLNFMHDYMVTLHFSDDAVGKEFPFGIIGYWVIFLLGGGGKDKSGWQCKTDHSPQFTAKIKNDWSYTFTPLTQLHGVSRNTFTLILHLGKQGTRGNTV